MGLERLCHNSTQSLDLHTNHNIQAYLEKHFRHFVEEQNLAALFCALALVIDDIEHSTIEISKDSVGNVLLNFHIKDVCVCEQNQSGKN